MNELLNNLWAAGVSFIVLSGVISLALIIGASNLNALSKYYENDTRDEYIKYSAKLKFMAQSYSAKQPIYAKLLFISGLVLICISFLSKI